MDWARSFIRRLTGWLYPQCNRCLICGMPQLRERNRLLCVDCAAALADCAARASTPEEQREVAEFVWIAAPYRYAGAARQLVRLLKYSDTWAAAFPLGEAMAARVDPARWDLILPVPLHRKRLAYRGYNQAALLGARVAELSGLPQVEDALTRVRGGRSQVGRTRAQRLHHLRGAFQANPAQVSGKRVLLVDDVCTTGATGAACAAALWQAGALEVGLLTACRVQRV